MRGCDGERRGVNTKGNAKRGGQRGRGRGHPHQFAAKEDKCTALKARKLPRPRAELKPPEVRNRKEHVSVVVVAFGPKPIRRDAGDLTSLGTHSVGIVLAEETVRGDFLRLIDQATHLMTVQTNLQNMKTHWSATGCNR